ncbi:MAG: CpsB/CapC family capsule biosynthesis tyrosine phosphatase [Bacteroidota bacterium]
MTDVHAHLLPDIDDGPKHMETTIAMIKALVELGYKKLIATPHVYWDYYPNTKRDILERLLEVQREVEKAGLAVTIDAAAEYFLEEHFVSLVKKREVLTLDRTDYVLVECSLLQNNLNLRDYLFEAQVHGYRPVLAHPERYLYFKESDYAALLELGCSFQLNLMSLAGHYGYDVKRRAQFLLKKNWISFLGTDAHHLKHIDILRKTVASRKIRRLLGNYSFQNDTFSNVRFMT